MISRTNTVKPRSPRTSVYYLNLKKINYHNQLDCVTDADVKTALDNYQSSINRYNNTDLSDPRIENVYFLERQVAYISLQLALAKARLREVMDPTLDYTSFENLLRFLF